MTRLWLALLLGLVVGCARQSEVESLKAEIVSLNAQIRSLKNDYDGINRKLNIFTSHMGKMQRDMLISGPQKTITLDWSNGGYQKIDTDVGYFVISLDNVAPYLDGQRLKIKIGNPSTATYKGFDLEFKWGHNYDNGSDILEWEESLNRKTASFTKSLRPGTWNRVEVALAPASSEQLQYIEISMKVNVLSLNAE